MTDIGIPESAPDPENPPLNEVELQQISTPASEDQTQREQTASTTPSVHPQNKITDGNTPLENTGEEDQSLKNNPSEPDSSNVPDVTAPHTETQPHSVNLPSSSPSAAGSTNNQRKLMDPKNPSETPIASANPNPSLSKQPVVTSNQQKTTPKSTDTKQEPTSTTTTTTATPSTSTTTPSTSTTPSTTSETTNLPPRRSEGHLTRDHPIFQKGPHFYSDWGPGEYLNLFFLFIAIVGAILIAVSDSETFEIAATLVFRLGLFGFIGGFTNWVAIYMLFEEVPFLYGSGIILKHFKEIRSKVKRTIMITFFDIDYLTRYVTEKSDTFLEMLSDDNGNDPITPLVSGYLNSPNFDTLLDQKLAQLAASPQGVMMQMMFRINPVALKPLIKPFIFGFIPEIGPMIKKNFDIQKILTPKVMKKIRAEIDELMEYKLTFLSAELVKKLIEAVIRNHLTWLIVWGVVMSSVLGLITGILNVAIPGVCL